LGQSALQKRFTSKSVLIEMGHIGCWEKSNFQISFDGNWAHRMSEKIEIPDLFGWKWGTPDVGKN